MRVCVSVGLRRCVHLKRKEGLPGMPGKVCSLEPQQHRCLCAPVSKTPDRGAVLFWKLTGGDTYPRL